MPEVGAGVLMDEWPGTGRYFLVDATTRERIGHATKKPFTSRWEAYTAHGTKVPGSRTYGTRREALVQAALHHSYVQKTATKPKRSRRT